MRYIIIALFFPIIEQIEESIMLRPSLTLALDRKQNQTNSKSQLSLDPSKISTLFTSPPREVFDLSCLKSSPLLQTYPDFAQLLAIIESFNQQTLDVQHGLSRPLCDIIRLATIRFLYRQMLTVSVMDKREIEKNDYAGKLKRWYLKLNDRSCFLRGVNFKKRKTQQVKLQQLIRQSYRSNVYDQIDDYLRKKMEYADKVETGGQIKRKLTEDCEYINLPMIDIQLYKREDANLRNYRQQQFTKKYLVNLKINQSKIRETALLSIKKNGISTLSSIKQQKNSNQLSSSCHQGWHNRQTWKAKDSNIQQEMYLKRKPSTLKQVVVEKKARSHLKLININGINLINANS